MLDIQTARKIGINACIDKLGRDFVSAHKDSATSAYGENGDVVFCFVGVDDRHESQNRDGVLILDSQSTFPYRASCNVELESGTPSFVEYVCPN